MSSTAKRKDHLETFFDQTAAQPQSAPAKAAAKSRRGYTVVEDLPVEKNRTARAGDLFDQIVEGLEENDAEETKLPAKSASAGAREVRERWSEEYRNSRDGDTKPGRTPTDILLDAAKFVATKGLAWITIIALAFVLILGVRYGLKAWGEHREAQAAAERLMQQKRSAFVNAGWRESQRVDHSQSPAEDENTEVAYLKELGPNDGRIHLQIITKGDAKTYSVSGWVRTAAQRAQALDEINSAFPAAKANIDQVSLRLDGGQLGSQELRLISGETRYGPDGKQVQRLQYGESGYAPLRPDSERTIPKHQNIVYGQSPCTANPCTPYYFVIGGGGQYWRTPVQRQKLIDTAFERLRAAPDAGRTAQAILLVYYEGSHPIVEEIMITTAPQAETGANPPSSISQGQSTTLTWSTSESTQVTLDGQPTPASGRRTEKPDSSSTYKLSTTDGNGRTVEREVNVTVEKPPAQRGKNQ